MALVGGVSTGEAIRELKRRNGGDALILGTPGRCFDLIKRGVLKIGNDGCGDDDDDENIITQRNQQFDDGNKIKTRGQTSAVIRPLLMIKDLDGLLDAGFEDQLCDIVDLFRFGQEGATMKNKKRQFQFVASSVTFSHAAKAFLESKLFMNIARNGNDDDNNDDNDKRENDRLVAWNAPVYLDEPRIGCELQKKKVVNNQS